MAVPPPNSNGSVILITTKVRLSKGFLPWSMPPFYQICCKSVEKLLRNPASKQTNKQTNADENITFLGGGNNLYHAILKDSFVCLRICVCEQENSKSCGRISVKHCWLAAALHFV